MARAARAARAIDMPMRMASDKEGNGKKGVKGNDDRNESGG